MYLLRYIQTEVSDEIAFLSLSVVRLSISKHNILLLYESYVWLLEILSLALVYWVYDRDRDPPLFSFWAVTLCEKQNLCFLLTLHFNRIVFVIQVLRGE